MKDRPELNANETDGVDLERRRALSRLGLGLSAAYAVPALLTLTRPASAGRGGSGGRGSGGGSGGAGGGSGGSGGASGGASGGSGPSGGGGGPV